MLDELPAQFNEVIHRTIEALPTEESSVPVRIGHNDMTRILHVTLPILVLCGHLLTA